MEYLLCLLASLFSSINGFSMKQYQEKTKRIKNADCFFNFGISLFALLFYAVTGSLSDGLSASPSVICYALIYGIGYAVGTVGCLFALQRGSLVITVIVCQMGALIPILYSIFVYGEEVTPFTLSGMLSLLLAVFLFNMKKEAEPKEKKRGGLSFWIGALLGGVGNGTALLAIKMQQSDTPGEKGSALLFYGILVASVTFLALLILCRPHIVQSETKSNEKCLPMLLSGSLWMLMYGVCNATANLLGSIVVGRLPAVVYYMIMTGFGILVSFVLGWLVFKERLSLVQRFGVAVATVGLVLLTAF